MILDQAAVSNMFMKPDWESSLKVLLLSQTQCAQCYSALREHDANLEHGDDGPKQRVEVLPVWDGVPILQTQRELTPEQMHAQDTAETRECVRGLGMGIGDFNL